MIANRRFQTAGRPPPDVNRRFQTAGRHSTTIAILGDLNLFEV
jgi:hypothetical protein